MTDNSLNLAVTSSIGKNGWLSVKKRVHSQLCFPSALSSPYPRNQHNVHGRGKRGKSGRRKKKYGGKCPRRSEGTRWRGFPGKRGCWKIDQARAGIAIVIPRGTNKRAGSRFDRSFRKRAVAFDCRVRAGAPRTNRRKVVNCAKSRLGMR